MWRRKREQIEWWGKEWGRNEGKDRKEMANCLKRSKVIRGEKRLGPHKNSLRVDSLDDRESWSNIPEDFLFFEHQRQRGGKAFGLGIVRRQKGKGKRAIEVLKKETANAKEKKAKARYTKKKRALKRRKELAGSGLSIRGEFRRHPI